MNQNAGFNNVPVGVGPLRSLPAAATQSNHEPAALQLPAGLGITKHTIGSARQIQMSLHLDF